MQNVNSTPWTAPSNARWHGVRPGTSAQASPPSLRVWGPWAVAVLLFGGLMFSFHSVVQASVDRAGQQQLQAEDRAQAETRCQAEATYGQRQSCLAGVKAAASLAAMR